MSKLHPLIQFNFRVNPAIIAKARAAAQVEGISLSKYIINAILKALESKNNPC